MIKVSRILIIISCLKLVPLCRIKDGDGASYLTGKTFPCFLITVIIKNYVKLFFAVCYD